jgi:hypothetical protein
MTGAAGAAVAHVNLFTHLEVHFAGGRRKGYARHHQAQQGDQHNLNEFLHSSSYVGHYEHYNIQKKKIKGKIKIN